MVPLGNRRARTFPEIPQFEHNELVPGLVPNERSFMIMVFCKNLPNIDKDWGENIRNSLLWWHRYLKQIYCSFFRTVLEKSECISPCLFNQGLSHKIPWIFVGMAAVPVEAHSLCNFTSPYLGNGASCKILSIIFFLIPTWSILGAWIGKWHCLTHYICSTYKLIIASNR